MLIPSLVYRLSYLLLADEFRLSVLVDAFGVPLAEATLPEEAEVSEGWTGVEVFW